MIKPTMYKGNPLGKGRTETIAYPMGCQDDKKSGKEHKAGDHNED